MAYDEDETPRSSLRSIPPVARASLPPPPPEPPTAATWFWAVGALAMACAIAIAAPRFRTSPEAGYGAGAAVEAPELAGPGFRTELVRDVPLSRRAKPPERGRPAVAVVPRSAVTRMEGHPMVFVADRDLRLLVATPVELGATEGNEQRVLSGIAAGQLVVTEGLAMLERQAQPRR